MPVPPSLPGGDREGRSAHTALPGLPQGPVTAKTRPGEDCTAAYSVLPSGLKTGPVNSVVLASSRASR
ncbi:MAG: hypothetical protein JWN08_2393 [Frankiales bacterium]|jgi:hypothetical protein|nr:hypothetical protein [Frankiales bacterium]